MPTAEQWAIFWSMGDVNLDGKIDEKDLDFIISAMGTFNPLADIDRDNLVTTADLDIASSNYSLEIYEYFGITKPIDWVQGIIIGGFVLGMLVVIDQVIFAEKKS